MRNDTDRAAGERIAANTPIQGSAADLCKLAMLAIDRRLPAVAPDARMLLQVHDELVFEAPEAEVAATERLVRAAMERPYPLDVPLVVGVGRRAELGRRPLTVRCVVRVPPGFQRKGAKAQRRKKTKKVFVRLRVSWP